jgi:Calcium-dependent channel, 7TM region, putative phosphate
MAKNQDYNIFAILAQFYQTNSGVFFMSILIQNACLSMCINLVRPGEISYAFFSPWLAHYRRKYINDSQAWRRKEGFVFLYGYYYAMQVIIFSIVIVFASTVPMVTVGGVLFFLMRHMIDSFNLLTVNKKEIDSSSKMFRKILLNLQFGLVLLQLCMISYLGMSGYRSGASFVTIVLAITLVVIFLNNKNLFDLAKQDQSIFNDVAVKLNETENDGHIDITEDSALYLPLLKWRSEYSHPLMLTRTGSEITSVGMGGAMMG